jgi:hydrogenase maturation factor
MELDAAPERCITCSDAGDPMRVLALDGPSGLADCVDESGAEQAIAVDLLESVAVGDDILVHAGVAIAHMGRCRV